MATKSRRVRRLKHQQDQTRLLRALSQNFDLQAFAQQANKAATTARILLMALLAQHGGQLEVTVGTLEQAQANAASLGWTVTPKKDDPKTYVVALVTEGT